MAYEFNDLKGLMFVVLFIIPLTSSTNIDCKGKPFHCLNSTHFMICVDLGGGVSSTIDDFIIPCPPTTVCHETNRFECEFPKIEEAVTSVSVIGIPEADNAILSNSDTATTIVPVAVTTVLPIAEPEMIIPTLEEITFSPNVELLENLKDEYTSGNEKFFELSAITPTNIISIHNYSVDEIITTTPEVSETIIITDNNTESTSITETSTFNSVEASMTDSLKSIDMTTSIEGLFSTSIDNRQMPLNYEKEQSKATDTLLTETIFVDMQGIFTTSSPYSNTGKSFDLDKPPDNMSLNIHTDNSTSFELNVTTPNTSLNNITEITTDDINLSEKMLENNTTLIHKGFVNESTLAFDYKHAIINIKDNITSVTETTTPLFKVTSVPRNSNITVTADFYEDFNNGSTQLDQYSVKLNTDNANLSNNEFIASSLVHTTPSEDLIYTNTSGVPYTKPNDAKVHLFTTVSSISEKTTTNARNKEELATNVTAILLNGTKISVTESLVNPTYYNVSTNALLKKSREELIKKNEPLNKVTNNMNLTIPNEETTQINSNYDQPMKNLHTSNEQNTDVHFTADKEQVTGMISTFGNGYGENNVTNTYSNNNSNKISARDNLIAVDYMSKESATTLSLTPSYFNADIEVTTKAEFTIISNGDPINNKSNYTFELVDKANIPLEKKIVTAIPHNTTPKTETIDITNDLTKYITLSPQFNIAAGKANVSNTESNESYITKTGSETTSERTTEASQYVKIPVISTIEVIETKTIETDNTAVDQFRKQSNATFIPSTSTTRETSTVIIETSIIVTSEPSEAASINENEYSSSSMYTTTETSNSEPFKENINVTASITINETGNIESPSITTNKPNKTTEIEKKYSEIVLNLGPNAHNVSLSADVATQSELNIGDANITIPKNKTDFLNLNVDESLPQLINSTLDNPFDKKKNEPFIYTDKRAFNFTDIIVKPDDSTSINQSQYLDSNKYDTQIENPTIKNQLKQNLTDNFTVAETRAINFMEPSLTPDIIDTTTKGLADVSANKILTSEDIVESSTNITYSPTLDIIVMAETSTIDKKPEPTAVPLKPFSSLSSSTHISEPLTVYPDNMIQIVNGAITEQHTNIATNIDFSPDKIQPIELDTVHHETDLTLLKDKQTTTEQQPSYGNKKMSPADGIPIDITDTALSLPTEIKVMTKQNTNDVMNQNSFVTQKSTYQTNIDISSTSITTETLFYKNFIETNIYNAATEPATMVEIIKNMKQTAGIPILSDIILNNTQYMNKTFDVFGNETNKAPLTKVKQNTTSNSPRISGSINREDMNLGIETDSLMTYMNVDMERVVGTKDYDNKEKNESSTTYSEIISRIESTSLKPFDHINSDKMSYNVASIFTGNVDTTNLTYKANKTTTKENHNKYFLNNSMNESDNKDNKPVNNGDTSSANQTKIGEYKIYSNLKEHQTKLGGKDTALETRNEKPVNGINNKLKLESDNSNDLTVNSNDSSKGNITDSISNFDCQNRTRGKHADNKDCRKFYICVGKLLPIEGICPNNTVFSEINKQCTRNLSHCIRNNQFHCLYEGRFSDFFKDNIYYICVKNSGHGFLRYKLQCQIGYHLNKATITCDTNVDTSSQSAASISETSKVNNESDGSTTISEEGEKSNNSDFACVKTGKFPHLKDCRKYYVCSKSSKDEYRRKIKKCSSDQVYDEDKKKCVSSDSNEC